MIDTANAFSGFSVNDIKQAKKFYGDTLGMNVTESPQGLDIQMAGGSHIFVYPKPDHTPATFTILNFPVDNIDQAVDELAGKGIRFEHYDMGDLKTDAKGIARSPSPEMGPNIAWFKDPAGNILSVLEIK